mmetsp:Transcript_4747/g.14683  ORF Transcript_4747/g.14683 Transcript_4747/m.14683 type:complete len:317 (-) Transcript_4747:685-1635(-)
MPRAGITYESSGSTSSVGRPTLMNGTERADSTTSATNASTTSAETGGERSVGAYTSRMKRWIRPMLRRSDALLERARFVAGSAPPGTASAGAGSSARASCARTHGANEMRPALSRRSSRTSSARKKVKTTGSATVNESAANDANIAIAGIVVVVDVAKAEIVVSAVTRIAGPDLLSDLPIRSSSGSASDWASKLSTRMITESTCTPSRMSGSSAAIDANRTPIADAMPKPPPTARSTLTIAITPSSTRERWSDVGAPSVSAMKSVMMPMPTAKSGMSPVTTRPTSSSNERVDRWKTSTTSLSTAPAMPAFHAGWIS